MSSVLNRTDIPFRERVFLASVEEPTERIYRRMRESITHSDVEEFRSDELLAYIDILEERTKKLRGINSDLEDALY